MQWLINTFDENTYSDGLLLSSLKSPIPAFAHFAGPEAEFKFAVSNPKVPVKPFGRELEAQSPFLGTVTAPCSSGTEIAIPAHSPLPARDISRARLGSERRASVRGLAGDGSGEGPYGRTQPRSCGEQRLPRHPHPPGNTDAAAASRETEPKTPQHLRVLPLRGAERG